MTDRIERFIRNQAPTTPFLVVDLNVIARKFLDLQASLPGTGIYYAVKANPAPEVVRQLLKLGSNFDVASPREVDLTLAQGAQPGQLSYSNTIKKEADIAYAFGLGVDLFAFDSEGELEKLSRAAPGARVFCRLLVNNAGADWPLSRKFGCEPEMALALLRRARELGLIPYGLSFHVGSQQRQLEQWDRAIEISAAIFSRLEAEGIDLVMLDLGGGIPARYNDEVATVADYALQVDRSLKHHFGNRVPRTTVEPGRYLVAESGVIESEVVLVSKKSEADQRRWVYLDIGRFGGLAETEGEMIRYPITTGHDGGESGPVTIAGPTCDSVDVIYENAGYELPLALTAGDRVRLHSTGAYTTTYASVGFNGFDPLEAYYI
jgi:ornithine decarboxylase